MAKQTTKITLTQKDILGLVAEKYDLKLEGAKIHVSHYKGSQREPEYTEIIIEAEKSI